jgi:hypothetical protein
VLTEIAISANLASLHIFASERARYVRDWSERKSNFEVIVGRSMPEDGPSRYLGFVHGFDDNAGQSLTRSQDGK